MKYVLDNWYVALVVAYFVVVYALAFLPPSSFKPGRWTASEAFLFDKDRYTDAGLRRVRRAQRFAMVAGAALVLLGLLTGRFDL
jgi:hypothetical protein